MTVENDAIAEVARRFAETIHAERTATLEALAAEREAAQRLLTALRREHERQKASAVGAFVTGVVVGAVLGFAAVALFNPRSGRETRQYLAARVSVVRQSFAERLRAAISAGQRAAAEREQELWREYRKRMSEQPPQEPLA
jgi:gas vesicle protein